MTTLRFLGVLVLAAGCATSGDADDDGTISEALSSVQAQAVLDLVNYPGVDREALDHDVGLDARAAAAIDAHRTGADGRFPSNDDRVFATLDEVDALPHVGNAAFSKLAAYAAAHPAPAAERAELVHFKGWEAEIVVWGANTVPIGVLNGLLDNRAAINIVDARPIANLSALAAVPLIGQSALQAMRGQGRAWWAARKSTSTGSMAGTYDGVAFDDATAVMALDIANTHAREAMVAGGVYAAGAAAIVGNRPYTTLAQVAAVSGVGTSTMRGLHAYATALLGAPRGTVAENDECTATAECAAGVCAGLTWSDVGYCRAPWMANTFTHATPAAIPDGAPGGVTQWIAVTGLASVVEDLIVHLDIDHPRPQDLRVTLTQPSSHTMTIWAPDSAGPARVVVEWGVERDSNVNGTWTLEVVDTRTGAAGTVRSWSLELTSRWD